MSALHTAVEIIVVIGVAGGFCFAVSIAMLTVGDCADSLRNWWFRGDQP